MRDWCPAHRYVRRELRCEEIRRGMVEQMKPLAGSLVSSVSMLMGLSPERIEELGGTGDWED